jgi:DNA-binding beta-propeller fold protein YncE
MNTRFRPVASLLAGAAALCLLSAPARAATFDAASRSWTHGHAAQGSFLAEIAAFDSTQGTLWVAGVSGVDVLDARTGTLIQRIDTRGYGSINSVAIRNGVAAMAFEASVRTDAGQVALFDTRTRSPLAGISTIAVGALPDMLTFTPDGSKLLVANEGTPTVYGTLTSAAGVFPRQYGSAALDPVGSVSIIDMASRTVSATATFAGVAQSGSFLRTTTGMDFEPEYIAVNAAGTKAYVSVQEANGMGVLNLQTGAFESLIGLGAKDFNTAGNRIDPLNNNNPSLVNVPVQGLYQPDGIAAYSAAGKTYLVMANEGDFREDDADRSAANNLGATAPLNALRVSNTDSSPGKLFTAGARSFSIRDENGVLVYDSGEILDREAIAAGIYDDARSRDKGVEPEGVELLTIGDRTYAFVGLERTLQSSLAVFDITDPEDVRFERLLVSPGDVSPEGLKGYQLDGAYYMAFSNEVSNTTSAFRLASVPEPGTLALVALAVAAAVGARRDKAV